MKVIGVVVLLLAVASCPTWAAIATVTATPSGGNVIYNLTVNGAPQNIEGLYLYFDVNNAAHNTALKNANFNDVTGYVSAPTGWDPVGGDEAPAWVAGTSAYYINKSGGTGSFSCKYIGSGRPNAFKLFWTVNAGLPNEAWVSSDAMSIVPEPASILPLLTGLIGIGGVVTRRRK